MEENDFSKYKLTTMIMTRGWRNHSTGFMKHVFLWSLYLFELAKALWDIPLATLFIYTLEDLNLLPKSKFADVIAYIAQECKEVADRLPESFERKSRESKPGVSRKGRHWR